MTMAELVDLWDGHQWSRSRDMEVLVQTILWLLAPHISSGDVDFDKVSKSLPGYDREFQKSLGVDRPRVAPWNKKKTDA